MSAVTSMKMLQADKAKLLNQDLWHSKPTQNPNTCFLFLEIFFMDENKMAFLQLLLKIENEKRKP